jgi:hypothetical protein
MTLVDRDGATVIDETAQNRKSIESGIGRCPL